MKYDYSKLRGLIKEKLHTEGAFAEAIGRTQGYVSKVFVGKSYFYPSDIEKAIDILGIPTSDIGLYFFTKEVHETELCD